MAGIRAAVQAAVEKLLDYPPGVFMSELEHLNDLAPPTEEKCAFLLSNQAGHCTPFYVWAFRESVFQALMDMFHEGLLSVVFATSPGLIAATTAHVSKLPMFTDASQADEKPQRWAVMQLKRGLDRNGGHWFRPAPGPGVDDNTFAFHWNDRASADPCPLPASPTHVVQAFNAAHTGQ